MSVKKIGAVPMDKKRQDEYSEQETAHRRDAVIKLMLSTPPKPHSEMKIGKSKRKMLASPPKPHSKMKLGKKR